jgi:hypothetical protein
MGRIFFLSAVALLAYRYIARSNKTHQALNGSKKVEVLPPAPSPNTVIHSSAAIDSDAQPKLVAAGSRATEPEPTR